MSRRKRRVKHRTPGRNPLRTPLTNAGPIVHAPRNGRAVPPKWPGWSGSHAAVSLRSADWPTSASSARRPASWCTSTCSPANGIWPGGVALARVPAASTQDLGWRCPPCSEPCVRLRTIPRPVCLLKTPGMHRPPNGHPSSPRKSSPSRPATRHAGPARSRWPPSGSSPKRCTPHYGTMVVSKPRGISRSSGCSESKPARTTAASASATNRYPVPRTTRTSSPSSRPACDATWSSAASTRWTSTPSPSSSAVSRSGSRPWTGICRLGSWTTRSSAATRWSAPGSTSSSTTQRWPGRTAKGATRTTPTGCTSTRTPVARRSRDSTRTA